MTLFISQNGRAVCERHGGFYLERLVERDEKLNKHPAEYTTPLDHWVRINPLEVERHGLECETCADRPEPTS